jgi:two-component system response regulator DevR
MEPQLDGAARTGLRMDALRIFLVEDSPMLRERLAETLANRADVKIVGHAETESAALDSLQAQAWDVLILDLQLLHGTGLGVLRGLSGRRNPGTTVIVLTNYSIPSYRTHSMQLGADYFFDKMQEFGRVFDVLSEISGRRQAVTGEPGPTRH